MTSGVRPSHAGDATVDGAVDAAVRVLGERARRDVPLAPLTTYKVGGAAAVFVDATGLDDLRAVGEAAAASGLPVLVVGRGSNLLVADRGFRGIAVAVTAFADWIEIPAGAPGPEGAVVRAGGAVALPVLARRTAAAALTGFEWAVGVPGSVGGAVRMNAGGHGADIAASLVDADVVDVSGASGADGVERRPASSLGLHFRGSTLRDTDVVVAAGFALRPGDREASERQLAEVVRWRREHQPGGQNCGSVFVNPVPGEVTAGGLIDGLGLRGLRIGGAWVSEKHANFIQASESATADDVRAVIDEVRARVADATGHVLRSEVRLVGFEDPS